MTTARRTSNALWAIGWKRSAAIALGLGSFVLVGYLSFRAARDFGDDARAVARSHHVLEAIQELRTAVFQPESEVRGYVLTGDPAYLQAEPYARDHANRTLRVLDSLLRANPTQYQLLSELRPVVSERIDRFETTVETRRTGGSVPARAMIATQIGRKLTTEIESRLMNMEVIERRILADRNAVAEQRSRQLILGVIVGTGLSLIILLTVFLLLNREIGAREDAEREARSSEERLLAFLELVPAGIYVLTADGRPFFANRMAQYLLGQGIIPGITTPELTERYRAFVSGTNVTYPTERLPIVRALHGERSTVDDLEIDRGGDRIPLLITGAPVHGPDGNLIYAMAAFLDISAQKNIQRLTEENEERFRQIVENASDIIYRTDANGRFTFVNPIGLKTFGLSEQDALHRHYLEFVRADQREQVKHFYYRQAAALEASTYLELIVVTADGTELILGQNVTLLRDEHGVSGFQSVARDITRERQAQTALARREQQLDTVIAGVDEGITYSDDRGHFQIFNKKMEDLTGYSMEEANSVPDFSSLLYPEITDHQSGLDRLQEVIEKRVIRDVETVIRTKHGEERTLLVSTTLIPQGDRRMFLSVYRDITDRRNQMEQLREAMEAARQAARARGEFLATMSHEIRTPMNGVIGMTDVLLQTDLTTEQRDYVETIRTSGETLLTIINDILDFSKIESGRLELERRPFELVECIENVYELLAFQAREKNLDLLYQVEPGVPHVIVGDETRIRQILLNLIGNAVKFTLTGHVHVRVTHTPVTDTEIEVRVAVADTGIGISQGSLDRLFQPFSQVDSSTTRRFGGTGLGLVISQRLVGLMGGHIEASSEPGRGSTFSFTFRTHAASEAGKARLRLGESALASLKGRRVFIVDDSPTNLEILRLQLSRWGLRPSCTEHSISALDLFRTEGPFDLAILDLQMPGLDGIELARQIRVATPGGTPPIVLLSSQGSREDLRSEDAALFFNVLTKPVRQHQLVDILTSALGVAAVSGEVTQRPEPKRENLAERMPLSVLVAEDNPVNQKLILRLLKKIGYDAALATDGKEAVDMALAAPYDIILMDVNMPLMDGLEATREILSHLRPGQSPPSVLALTAGVLQEDRDRCAQAGMVGFLSKPIRLEELRATLDHWGAHRAKQRPVADPGLVVLQKDQELIDRIRTLVHDTDAPFVKSMLEDFLPHADQRLAELDRLLGEEAWEELRHEAHSLKGGALNVGAATLGGLCASIQYAVEQKRTSEVGALLAAAHDAWTQTRADIETLLKEGLTA